MAIHAPNVIAPVLTAAEIIVIFFSGVTTKTRFRCLFRRLRLEGNNLLRIAFFEMRLAGSMTRLATRDLSLPAVVTGKACVGCMRERFKLVFVTILTSLTAHVIFRREHGDFSRAEFRGLSCLVVGEPADRRDDQAADHECFDELIHR